MSCIETAALGTPIVFIKKCACGVSEGGKADIGRRRGVGRRGGLRDIAMVQRTP
jgi:hypothetical protein